MLQLHQALDLFCQGPSGQGLQVLEFQTDLHQLHVLGEVQEPGPATTIPDNVEGDLGSLRMRRRPDRLISTHLVSDTLALASGISGWVQVTGGWGGTVSHGRLTGAITLGNVYP